jgi:hypothetical protein
VLRHPIAVFVVAVLAVIGIGVGVLAGTNRGGLGPVGTVSGGFFIEGGPIARGIKAPVNGPVTLTSTTGTVFTTTANSKGEWTVAVSPGTYAVSGLDLDYHPPWRCVAGNEVRVRAGGTVTGVLIVCPLQ